MKKSHMALLIAACLLGGVMVLRDSLAQSQPAATPPGGTRIAVCDVQDVFANYERARDLLGKLNDDRQAAKTENDNRGKAIDALQAEMNSLKPGSPEYESRLSQLERMTIDRKVELQIREAALMRKHRNMTMDLYNEVLATIAKVAGEQGLNLVLYRDGELLETDETMELLAQIRSRKVLYCDGCIDITQTVLARLNDAYRSAGRR
jgi:Skp family chaperone for outer membrane proteins